MQNSRGYRPQPYTKNNANAYRQAAQEYEKPNAFLSVLLCIITIISLCVFIGLLVLRTTGVGHFIRETNVYEIMVNASEGEESTHYIINQVNGLPFHNQDLNLDDLSLFLHRESVSDEIGVIVDGYANAFIMGNLDHHVTSDDIVQMARNLDDDLYEFFGHRMTEADMEHLASTLDDVLDFNSLTINGLTEDFGIDLSVPLVLISPLLLWSVGILCILLLAVIFIIRRGNPVNGAFAVGITLTISGLFAFTGGLFAGANPGAFGETVERYYRYLEYPAHLLSQYGFFFAAVGIITIIISFMVHKVSKRIAEKV